MLKFPTSICERFSGVLVDSKTTISRIAKDVIRRHIGMKLDEIHPTHFLQIS
jgi:hypothetical protein